MKSPVHWSRSPKLGQNFSSDYTCFGVIKLHNWHICLIPFTRLGSAYRCGILALNYQTGTCSSVEHHGRLPRPFPSLFPPPAKKKIV